MNNGAASRRYFFFGSLLAGAVPAGGFGSKPSLKALGYKSVLDKVNIAGVGMGTRGGAVIWPMAVSDNIVALCDVHEAYSAKTFAQYPKAAKFKDFRKMLDAEGKNIDGVVIATPDHSHTPIALAAMQAGKHVYCEKPLTRTVWEARLLRDAAHKYNVATQMGNQGYSHEGTRTCAEILWSGEIGSVREVHAWTGAVYGEWFQVGGTPAVHAVPAGLDWDLWLTTAAARPYNEKMFSRWRAWIEFGAGGPLGDWIVHCLGPANLALQLHLAPPSSVECVAVTGLSRYVWPESAHLKYEFPERGAMPPVTFHVYLNLRGDVKYPEGMAGNESLFPPPNNLAERGRYAAPAPGASGRRIANPTPPSPPSQPSGPVDRSKLPGNGSLFVGDKGHMATVAKGEGVWLLPASRWEDYMLPPQMLPRGVNHQQDWLRAVKGGAPACSNFDIAVPYIEWLMLGTVAMRVPNKKLLWNAKKMEFTNSSEANQYLRPDIRKGWEMKL